MADKLPKKIMNYKFRAGDFPYVEHVLPYNYHDMNPDDAADQILREVSANVMCYYHPVGVPTKTLYPVQIVLAVGSTLKCVPYDFRNYFRVIMDLTLHFKSPNNTQGHFHIDGGNVVPGAHATGNAFQWVIQTVELLLPDASKRQFFLVNKAKEAIGSIPDPEFKKTFIDQEMVFKMGTLRHERKEKKMLQEAKIFEGENFYFFGSAYGGSLFYAHDIVFKDRRRRINPAPAEQLIPHTEDYVHFSVPYSSGGRVNFEEGKTYTVGVSCHDIEHEIVSHHAPVSFTLKKNDTKQDDIEITVVEPKISKIKCKNESESGDKNKRAYIHTNEDTYFDIYGEFLNMIIFRGKKKQEIDVDVRRIILRGQRCRDPSCAHLNPLGADKCLKNDSHTVFDAIADEEFFDYEVLEDTEGVLIRVPIKKGTTIEHGAYLVQVEILHQFAPNPQIITLSELDKNNHNVLEIRKDPGLDSMKLMYGAQEFQEHDDQYQNPYLNPSIVGDGGTPGNLVARKDDELKFVLEFTDDIKMESIKSIKCLSFSIFDEDDIKEIKLDKPHIDPAHPKVMSYAVKIHGSYMEIISLKFEIEYIIKGMAEAKTEELEYRVLFSLPSSPTTQLHSYINGKRVEHREWSGGARGMVSPITGTTGTTTHFDQNIIDTEFKHTGSHLVMVPGDSIVYKRTSKIDKHHVEAGFTVTNSKSVPTWIGLRVFLLEFRDTDTTTLLETHLGNNSEDLNMLTVHYGGAGVIMPPDDFSMRIKIDKGDKKSDSEIIGDNIYNLLEQAGKLSKKHMFLIDSKPVDVKLYLELDPNKMGGYLSTNYLIYCEIFTLPTLLYNMYQSYQVGLTALDFYEQDIKVYTPTLDIKPVHMLAQQIIPFHIGDDRENGLVHQVRLLDSTEAAHTFLYRQILEEFVEIYVKEHDDKLKASLKDKWSKKTNLKFHQDIEEFISLGASLTAANNPWGGMQIFTDDPIKFVFILALVTLLNQL
ncbi:MAG: hypothetical protein KKF44_06190, partial [Nanoarchaeota archaeon]|nr:hypothetical protein [Nanoarchaeota archaeon]